MLMSKNCSVNVQKYVDMDDDATLDLFSIWWIMLLGNGKEWKTVITELMFFSNGALSSSTISSGFFCTHTTSQVQLDHNQLVC